MKRILVVEDEASIRESGTEPENDRLGSTAPSAERALELIQKNPPAM